MPVSMKTLAARLQYAGGDQLGRIKKNKLNSLRSAIKSSYNTRYIKTPKHSSFPCLINKNLLKSDYDREFISVEFASGLEAGDTFECLDNGTHWMIYLPIITETAYLRSEIIRCRYTLTIDDVTYWVYLQGPTETTIQWFQKSGTEYNEPNLSGTMYIKKDERTLSFFKRFTNIQIGENTWQVQVVDSITVPGIIELELQEYYNNTPADLPRIEQGGCHEIVGVEDVEQKGTYGYMVRDAYYREDYHWSIKGNDRVEVLREIEDGRQCEIKVHDGAIRGFTLVYGNGRGGYSMDINIARRCTGIVGPKTVYPYDIVEYKVPVDGEFWVDTDNAEILSVENHVCKIEIKSSKSGDFVLHFRSDAGQETQLAIEIESL